MKNLPLSLQIWLVFAVIMLCISIILSILLPWTLRDFFTKEIYATIENAQILLFSRFSDELTREAWESGNIFRRPPSQDIRTVNHIIILKENQTIISPSDPMPRLPIGLLDKIKNETDIQDAQSQRYSGQVGSRRVFYVASKYEILGQDVFLVSYMGDSYREDLVNTLFKRLAVIMSFAFLLSWIPSLGLAKYLTKPLVTLEKRVEKLADRQWQDPIQLQREDEIGRLGKSVEKLRQQLVIQDEAQQSFLQNVSHELKTPVMVIQSYTQAIRDGIFPKGNLSNTLQIIEDESERLKKLIYNLLYLTKLDYLATHKPTWNIFDMDVLIKDVIERLRWQRNDLDWPLELSPVKINGDIEQWRVVLENLLDNQIRHADRQIAISLKQQKQDNKEVVLIHIWNDGPCIDPERVNILFEKFYKGEKGKYGLGLAIVNRIISLHNGRVWATNETVGVSFYVEIPIVS